MEEISEPEYARDDDKLFRSDVEDWQYNACLNYMTEKLGPYADGYKSGADALVNICLTSESGRDLDTLVYPIVFNYRQYIELRLKELIKGLHICNGIGSTFPQHHKIDDLWKEFKKLYIATGTDFGKVFQNTERIILEFASVDSNSMTFRYPEDKKGSTSYKQNINLRNLGEVMNRVATFIDAVSWHVSHMVDTWYDNNEK